MAGKLIARTLTAGAKPTQRVAEAIRLGFDPSRVFYHGTRSNIKSFDPSKMSKLGGNFGSGFYFSELPEVASQFARRGMPRTPYIRNVQVGPKDPSKVVETTPSDSKVGQMIKEMKKMLGKADEPAPNVMPVHLKMDNPLVLQTDSIDDTLDAQRQLARMFPDAKGSDDIAEVIQAAGYDSLVVKNPQGTVIESVVYKPNQIRSVYADFDPKAAKSGNVLASVDPVTAGGIGALLAEGGSEAIDYVRENVTPELIRDYGLAAASMIPGPQMIPAAATSLGIMATDAANYLMDPENRQALADMASTAAENFVAPVEDAGEFSEVQGFDNGGAVQNAEDNLQQYLRQQMLTQARAETAEELPGLIEARRAETADVIQAQLSPDAPPFAAEAARSVIDKNTQDMIDYYNYLQFEQDPSNLLERRAVDEAVYTGRVPFGYEDADFLYRQGRTGVLGNSLGPEIAGPLGIPREINVAGNRAAFSQVPIHEGTHPIIDLPKKEEENALRALDYFRMKRYGNEEYAQKILKEAGFDVTRPFGLGHARVLALKGAMSMTDDQFQNLSEQDRAELQDSFDAYKQAPGLIASALGSLTGEPAQPEFDSILITPENAAEMSEEDFNALLKAAPAFAYEKIFTSSIDITGPRMTGEGESAVQAYAEGGVVSLKDKAVNMTRGPRSNGIMQYVPYMTGATNGY